MNHRRDLCSVHKFLHWLLRKEKDVGTRKLPRGDDPKGRVVKWWSTALPVRATTQRPSVSNRYFLFQPKSRVLIPGIFPFPIFCTLPIWGQRACSAERHGRCPLRFQGSAEQGDPHNSSLKQQFVGSLKNGQLAGMLTLVRNQKPQVGVQAVSGRDAKA